MYWMDVYKTDDIRRTFDDREYLSDEGLSDSDDNVSFGNGDDASLSDVSIADTFNPVILVRWNICMGQTKSKILKLAAVISI
jgi:hypothetical protein